MAADSTSTKQFCAALFRETPLEFRLLAACCVWPFECGERQVRNLVSSHDLSWDLLLELGERHRVSGFVANALKNQPGVPAEVTQILRQRATRTERDNLLQLAIAVKVTQAMGAERIPFVIMKGAPLAQLLYGNTTVRHSKDIDLLVSKSDLSAAQVLLRQAGFEAASGLAGNLTARQTASWERHRKHYDFRHTATGVHVELHWRAYDNPRLGSVSVQDVEWVECSPGMRLPTLSREEMFPLLCAHGAGHAWFRLKWLVDVAALLAQSTVGGQSELMRLARQRGLERPAEQALLICAGLFDDDRIAPPARNTSVGRWLARVARNALQQPIPTTSGDAEFVPKGLAASRLLLRRGWVYRWEEAKVYAASPADWKAVRLPDWLHFAYPLVRIPLWFGRRWNRKRRA